MESAGELQLHLCEVSRHKQTHRARKSSITTDCPAPTWPKGVRAVGVAEMGEARPENEKRWPMKWEGGGVREGGAVGAGGRLGILGENEQSKKEVRGEKSSQWQFG